MSSKETEYIIQKEKFQNEFWSQKPDEFIKIEDVCLNVYLNECQEKEMSEKIDK